MKYNYKKVNIIIIVTCLIIIASLSVGYSILSQQLDINTNVVIRAQKDIRITNLSTPTLTDGAYEEYNGKYNTDYITTNINLPKLTSTVTYSATITNNGTDNMEINSITADTFNNDNMTYTIDGIDTGTIIESGQSSTFNIIFQYKKNIKTIPDNTSLGSIIQFNFIEYNPDVLAYAKNNMILKLEGINAPVNNTWIDSTYNNTFTLTNDISYNKLFKNYNFGTKGIASLNETKIPTTGNFTLETYIYTGNDITSNQTIISQKSDGDTGKIELNLKDGLITLIVNDNETGNKTFNITKASTYTQYLLQVVRSDSNILLYLNGNLVSTNTFNSTNAISDSTFDLSDSTNHYSGSIYAVRIYNRLLTPKELTNNYNVDLKTYESPYKSDSIYVKATNNVVTTGTGLYKNDNDYLYKGNKPNNYLQFNNDSIIYRIIGIYDDGTVKLVSTDTTTDKETAFDAASNHLSTTSTYCKNNNNGCNFYATTNSVKYKSTYTWSNGTVTNDSTIKKLVDSWYAGLNSNIKDKLIEHDFEEGFVEDHSTYDNMIINSKNIVYHGYAALMSLPDVVNASITPISKFSTSQNINDNYIMLMLNSTQQAWTMTPTTSDSWDVWTIAYGNQLSRKRASRTNQANGNTTTLFYALPSFYISATNTVTGTGSSTDPYIITE